MMQNIRKLFVITLALFGCLYCSNALAMEEKDIYYTNSNNVSFSKEVYDFVSKFYFDGYQKFMNQDDYDYIIDNDLLNASFDIKEVTDFSDSLSRATTYYATGSKKLQMTTACSTTCSVALTLTWFNSPVVRSYDLIGAYSPTSGSLKFANSRILYDSTTTQYVEYRQESNGVSATMKLPSSGESIKIIMNFKANPGTLVYASYQHAAKTITLANSRKFSFLGSGYGGVFRFDTSVSSYYDAMSGVKMTL